MGAVWRLRCPQCHGPGGRPVCERDKGGEMPLPLGLSGGPGEGNGGAGEVARGCPRGVHPSPPFFDIYYLLEEKKRRKKERGRTLGHLGHPVL